MGDGVLLCIPLVKIVTLFNLKKDNRPVKSKTGDNYNDEI